MIVYAWTSFSQVDSTKISSDSTSKNTVDKKTRKQNRAKYFNISIGTGSAKTQDFAVSPLLFKGINTGGGLEFLNKGVNSEWSINSLTGISQLNNENSSSPTQQVSTSLNLYYSRHCEHLSGEKFRTYIGIYNTTNANFRINQGYFNTALIYDGLSSFGISGKINSRYNFKTKKFGWNNQGKDFNGRFLAIDFQLNIPFFHLYSRPEYATISNFPSTEVSYINKVKTGTWGTVSRLSSRLDLTLFMVNNNGIKLSYYWDVYNINPDYNKVAVSNNSLLITLLLRLNKKTLE